MKKAVAAVFIFFVCVLSSGSGADPQPEKRVMNFLAVMNLNCGSVLEKDSCAALTDVVIEELVKIKKYTVIDRANRDKILSEAGFQQTGCVDESCTIEMGRQLGVGKLVVGTITKIGETYLVNLQLLNVETAAVEVAARERCDKCKLEDLIDTVINAARKLMGQAPVPTSTTAPQPQPAPPSTVQTPTVKQYEMILIPAGEFIMGSDAGRANEKPAHKVFLDGYLIDKYEVTNDQYGQCEKSGRCSPNKKWPGFTDPTQPVTGVNWEQASTFCSWAGKRLPTEAEWEKAARGTDGRKYPWGDGIDCSRANYYDCNLHVTKPVGSYPSGASPYGIMDMAGNVEEWVSDLYDKKYYETSPYKNPAGAVKSWYNILRGGSFASVESYVTTYYRESYGWSLNNAAVGFRCAKNP